MQTVYRAREDFRGRGLARSARSGKQIRVSYGLALYLVYQRADDVFLSYDLVPGVGTVFSVKG